VTTPTSAATTPPRPAFAWRTLAERYALVVLVIALFALFALLPESGSVFTSPRNIRALIANQGVPLLIAVAAVFPLAAGYFDFSVGAVAASSSVVTGAALSHFAVPLPLAVVMGVLFGTIVGTLLGLLIAYAGVNPFISTLGVATLLGGVIFAYTGGLRISAGIPPELTDIGSRDWLGVPRVVVVAGVVALIACGCSRRRSSVAGSTPSARTREPPICSASTCGAPSCSRSSRRAPSPGSAECCFSPATGARPPTMA
jgi:ribose transport system permease protein